MRVALFVHCFFPEHFYGTETYTLNVAKQLKDMGHEAVVVSAVFQGEAPRAELVTRYEFDGVAVYLIDKNKIPHKTIRETYYQPEMRSVFRGILRDVQPDVLHVTHLINHTGVLLEVAGELGLPAVGTLTDFFGFCYTNKLVAVDGSLCDGPSRSRANCVACHLRASHRSEGGRRVPWARDPGTVSLVSRTLVALDQLSLLKGRANDMVKDLRHRPDVLADCYRNYQMVVTPTRFLRRAYQDNGLTVPCIDIQFGVDVDREPKPLRQPGDPIRVGYIGQIAPHKGVDLLIEAMSDFPHEGARLDIFGPEDQDPAYMEKLRSMAGDRPVTFHGTFAPNRMSDTLRNLDLLAIPSRWPENSPLVLLDALATHTPVVVSDGEGLTEFVEEGRNGFSFAQGSVSALKRQLMRFVEDRSLAARMSAKTEYPRTSRHMVEELLPVYQQAQKAAVAGRTGPAL